METAYAQALWKAIENGKDPKEAVAAMVQILKTQGRMELLPRIKRALVRLAAREAATRPRIYVAHEKDAKHALAKSGVDHADVHVDPTLIGGWRLEAGDSLVDNSFKKSLLSIYSNVTT